MKPFFAWLDNNLALLLCLLLAMFVLAIAELGFKPLAWLEQNWLALCFGLLTPVIVIVAFKILGW